MVFFGLTARRDVRGDARDLARDRGLDRAARRRRDLQTRVAAFPTRNASAASRSPSTGAMEDASSAPHARIASSTPRIILSLESLNSPRAIPRQVSLPLSLPLPLSTVTTATRAGSLSASGSVAGPVVSAPVLRRAAVDPAGGGSRRIFSPSVAHGANGCPNQARISLTRRCVVAASTAGVD